MLLLHTLILRTSFSVLLPRRVLGLRRFMDNAPGRWARRAVSHRSNLETDMRRLLSFEPEGCFAAEIGGRFVGQVFSVSCGRLGWIGMLIVAPEHRRKGLGTLLVRKAMDYLLDLGVETIELDSVPEISSLYQKLGFTYECDIVEFVGKFPRILGQSAFHVKHVTEYRMKQIAKFDSQFFRDNRSRLLFWLYRDGQGLYSWVGDKSNIAGYLLFRRRNDGYRIGPYVCDPQNPEAARALLAACINSVNHRERLSVGVPHTNNKARNLLEGLSFTQHSKSLRMCFGRKRDRRMADAILGVGRP